MRESNFAFPAQNRACVCISSQLYDRRALDTTSALPLFNSLTHLTYLTSTSPRIREIMTMDGGLERLVRMLHDFCMCPPPSDNPAVLYGLSPPNARPAKLVPTLNPTSFDKQAAYRFSLAFQCVVNIGVRGSEPIRSRVVQAGTLDVVGCILEAWLANKGFAVGPSSSATGMPRESREQRLARRQAQQEQRERQEAEQLAGRLRMAEVALRRERTITASAYGENNESAVDLSTDNPTPTEVVASSSSSSLSLTGGPISSPPSSMTSIDTDADTSTDTSSNTTPAGSNTPTGAVLVPGRDRSGTIIGRPIWDQPTTLNRHRTHRGRDRQISPSTDTSRPETETEDDGDVDMDQSRDGDDTSVSPSPEPRPAHRSGQRGRRAVGIVSDGAPAPPLDALDVDADAHIIINDAQGGVVGGDGMGVEDGIVSLEPNDDFAMGAPPGAPGAIDGGTPPPRNGAGVERDRRTRTAPDVTPRAGTMNLPMTMPPMVGATPGRAATLGIPVANNTGATPRSRTRAGDTGPTNVTGTTPGTTPTSLGRGAGHASGHHHRDADSGPYRDEDVLLSLQLLAYLSKYPHVRQAFYKPRTTFHPASANLPNGRQATAGPSASASTRVAPSPAKDSLGFFRAFATAAGRGKEKAPALASSSVSTSSSSMILSPPTTTRQTNVFSLVERFTFRPSSTETDLPNPPPKLPPEIQYWAGVIMRNACRKDESRGGIRQCANMLCGKWETFPREFAKCRRCRKAKYCGKECQSTAWSEGHRFWCSAKDGEDDGDHAPGEREQAAAAAAGVQIADGGDDAAGPGVSVTAGGTVTGRTERRAERERQRLALIGRAAAAAAGGVNINEEQIRNVLRSSNDSLTVLQNLNATLTAAVGPNAPNVTVPPTRAANDPTRRGQIGGPLYVGPSGHARAALARPDVAPPTQHVTNYAVYNPLQTRRRSETVTGATSTDASPSTVSPHRPRHMIQPNPSPGRGAVDQPTDAGPSRGRHRMENSHRATGGDYDMVLG